MYCSQCGAGANGNFCSSCGAPLQIAASVARQAMDWKETLDYEALLRVPQIRDLISRHASQAKKRMTGEEFLQYCDKAFVPLTGVSVQTIASVVQPIYAKLGIKTDKTRSQIIGKPPGETLLAVLCSLARHGQPLRHVRQVQDGCLLEAVIPSDVWAFEGELLITVRRERAGALVEAGTVIKGQLFDWGKSNRCLQVLFSDLHLAPAA